MTLGQTNNIPQYTGVFKKSHWFRLIMVMVVSVLFWLAQFGYQYYIYEPGVWQSAWVRSHALAGTTLLAVSLLLSIIFKFKPDLAGQWIWRRNFGVAGFVLIFFHTTGVMRFYFGLDYLNPWPAWQGIFYTLNPFVNPILFGLPPMAILFSMAITSSDWAVRKLKKWWKVIHRFVYLAEIGIVYHVILTGGAVMKTLPGYLLYILGGAVIAGQIYWWWRISRLRQFKNLGFLVGLGLIILTLLILLILRTL